MLTKEQILQADDIKTKKVNVPEWGGELYICTMSGTERDAFEQSIIETRGKSVKVNLQNIRAKLCVQTIVDEKRNKLFSLDDVTALGKKSAKALDRIFAIAQKLNGISGEDVEDLAKNLGNGLSADSISN